MTKKMFLTGIGLAVLTGGVLMITSGGADAPTPVPYRVIGTGAVCGTLAQAFLYGTSMAQMVAQGAALEAQGGNPTAC